LRNLKDENDIIIHSIVPNSQQIYLKQDTVNKDYNYIIIIHNDEEYYLYLHNNSKNNELNDFNVTFSNSNKDKIKDVFDNNADFDLNTFQYKSNLE
jgi:hypothetical protein